MTTWKELERELGLWRSAGMTPTFWWRDDDTDAPTASLDRLIALAENNKAPVHLAVVPFALSPDLADRIARASDVYVMQHGLAHINHEPCGKRASEVGDHRELELQRQDLREGWKRLTQANLPMTLPGLTPPWNRIGKALVPHLPDLGYRLLSQFDARETAQPCRGLLQINCHVDPIRWKEGARFRGLEKSLDQIVTHLAARRSGQADRTEPTGLLTHHLQTDEDVWEFLEELMHRLGHHRDIEWVRLSSLLDAA